MENNVKNRMSEEPRKRGRPTLIEQAERQATAPPIPMPGPTPLFQCSRCGGCSALKIETTRVDHRVIRCGKCGYAHHVDDAWLAKFTIKPRT